MTTLKLDAINDYAYAVNRASEILRSGGIVAVPTETVYGLGGLATSDLAVKKIFEAKGRPSDNDLGDPVHTGDQEQQQLHQTALFVKPSHNMYLLKLVISLYHTLKSRSNKLLALFSV